MKENNILIGCEAFIKKENRILFGLRKNCFGDGTWGLPGGHLEFREKVVNGLKRELVEEIGIEFEDTDFKLATVTDGIDSGGVKHYVHISFEVEYRDQEIRLMEPERCSEWKFFDLNNLPANIFPAHIKIIRKYVDNIIY
ncbi:MAG: NUDIX domain-containing protein [Patescibacteria group bacterium]|mgnify:CR=1 FL=1